MDNPGNPVHFIRLYFNACYYMGAIPYRFRFQPKTNSYVVVESRVQKIFCVLIPSLTLLQSISGLRKDFRAVTGYDDVDYNPVSYFKMANYISDAVFYVILFTSQWFRQKEFLSLVNLLQRTPFYANTTRKHRAGIWVTLSVTVILINVIADIVFVFVEPKEAAPLPQIISGLKYDGMRLLFLGRWVTAAGSLVFTVLFVGLRFLTILSYIIFTTFGELLVLNCSLCLNECLNGFIDSVKDKKKAPEEVYNDFLVLKQTSEAMNKATGAMVFGVVLGLLPYFVSCFVAFFRPERYSAFVYNLVEFLDVYGFMICAANINRKANIISDRFIHEHDLSFLSDRQLGILLYEIGQGGIGFSGSDYFKITSGFLGSIVALILTFAVILIQFKQATPGLQHQTPFANHTTLIT